MLAGVSVSTVSKVLNNKADSISGETRQKVLAVVKQYNYTPYAGVKNLQKQKKYLLALCGLMESASPDLAHKIAAAAGNLGYNLLLSEFHENTKELIKAVKKLENKIDGMLLFAGPETGALQQWIQQDKLPVVLIQGAHDAAFKNCVHFATNWMKTGQMAYKHLAGYGHQKIGLLLEQAPGEKATALIQGLEQFYSHHEFQYDVNYVKTADAIHRLFQMDITAVVCDGEQSAAALYQFAREQEMLIPNDISVVVLTELAMASFSPKPVIVSADGGALAAEAVTALVNEIEGKKKGVGETLRYVAPKLFQGESVCAPAGAKDIAGPVLVVGSLNLDVVMTIPDMPEAGETMMIDSIYSLPGGKGANQAVGAAKLGGEVFLIGRVGSDPAGKLLYNTLRNYGVNTKAISMDREVETGKAYISVLKNGESFIEVYGGANHQIKKHHIRNNKTLFKRAAYCLVQMELPIETVEWIVDFAYENGAKVILKPCSVNRLPKDLLKKTYLLVPNQTEASRLAANCRTIQEQAEFFMDSGCGQVIITLAEKGCYYSSRESAAWYEAYADSRLRPVDAAGASDAFISALAVYLAEGNPMAEAIRFANVAAGLSVTREGVQPSLPDRTAIELLKPFYKGN